MKSIIVYYSYTNNTKKVAEILADYLKEKNNEVELMRLEAKEPFHFFTQAIRGLTHKKAKINPVNFDLKDYDLICFGSPVWAFGPAPAMNTYLNKCFNLEQKEVILFCTYGSGLGKERCLDYMQKILEKKQVKKFGRFSIQQFMVNNKEFILSKIKRIL
jgi:flavodoxin